MKGEESKRLGEMSPAEQDAWMQSAGSVAHSISPSGCAYLLLYVETGDGPNTARFSTNIDRASLADVIRALLKEVG